MLQSIHKFNIESLKEGDKKAYEEIYTEFFGVMYHLCLQYLHDEEVSQEIVQDTFMKLWDIRSSLNADFNIRNFLYTITKNNCLNYLRNQSAVLKYQSNLRYLEIQFNYEAIEKLGNYIEFDELRLKIDQAIGELPEDLRDTFILSRFEELKYSEIAEKQSVSIKTVEARISKALKILRLALKDYLTIIGLITNIFS